MVWKILTASGFLSALAGAVWIIWRELRLLRCRREQAMSFAALGHELKTPLNCITGFAGLLCDERIEAEERRRFAGEIGAASAILLEMIDNMLDCARCDAGKMELHLRPTDPAELVGGPMPLLEPLLAEKNLRLETDVRNDLPLVCVDPGRVRQILLNLVGNAIKFSDRGIITVSVRFTVTGPRRGCLTLSVSDQGHGIPEEFRQKIFEPFVRQRRHAMSVSGTGLGLAITARLVKLMNGAIGLESEPGRGSVFTVTLPDIACVPGEDSC